MCGMLQGTNETACSCNACAMRMRLHGHPPHLMVVLPEPLLPKKMYVVSLGRKPRRSERTYRDRGSNVVFSAVRSVKGFRESPNVFSRSVVGILAPLL